MIQNSCINIGTSLRACSPPLRAGSELAGLSLEQLVMVDRFTQEA